MTSSSVARTTVGLVIAAAVGTAMAGGLRRQAPAPVPGRVYGSRSVHLAARAAPAAARAAAPPGSIWWHVAAFGVFTIVCLFVVHRYYRYRWLRLRAEIAEVDGWQRFHPRELRDGWGCPACGAVMPLANVDQHQERSVCAAYERWLAETGGENGQPVRARAVPWVARESATVPHDDAVMAGGYDTLNDN